MPCSVSCRELIRILQRSSDAILLCFISEIAVTSVSMATEKSPRTQTDIYIHAFAYIQSHTFSSVNHEAQTKIKDPQMILQITTAVHTH